MKEQKPKPVLSLKARRRIQEIHAFRLANADFYYALDPSITAHLLGLSPEDSLKARKHPTYAARLDDLKLVMDRTMRQTFKEDSERLRMALSERVPKALEVLDRSLDSGDGQVALRAAQEILDRDGRMPKVSKVQTTPVDTSSMPDVEPKLLAEFMPAKPN